MAKGDHKRAQNKIDEQQKMSQSYLTGVQGQLGNQYGNLSNMYYGPNSPTFGSINGWGSTVPQYSPYGTPIYSGNGTDTQMANNPYGSSGGMGGDPRSNILNYLKSLGPANSATLEKALPQIQKMYPGTTRDNSQGPLDELIVPGAGLVDFIHGAEGGNPDPNWTWQTGPNSAMYLNGGLGGAQGMMGIPGMNMADYGKISSLYQSMLPMYSNLYGDLRGQYGNFLGSASNMAKTGGLSDTDKAAMRSRAMSPIKAQYQLGTENLDRQRALQGGYSPGYTTALGRFNRQYGQGLSDAATGAEAEIARLVQQGKLGGLGAWGSGLSGMGSGLLGALGGMNQSIGGMSGLYGTTPAWTNTMGNQALAASGQQLDAAKIQAGLSDSIMQNQIKSSGIPGNWESAMSNIWDLGKAGSAVGGAIYPWV